MRVVLLSAVFLSLSCQAQIKIPSGVSKAAGKFLPKSAEVLTETDASDGLKEALIQGVKTGSDLLGAGGALLNQNFIAWHCPRRLPILRRRLTQIRF